MFANLSGTHLIVILVVVLLLFGAPKLPALARSVGQSLRILKSEVGGGANSVEDRVGSSEDRAEAPHLGEPPLR